MAAFTALMRTAHWVGFSVTYCHPTSPPEGPRGPVRRGSEGAVGGQGGEDTRDVAVRTPPQLGPALRHRQVWRRPAAGAHGLPSLETAAGQSCLVSFCLVLSSSVVSCLVKCGDDL